jgi:hypothetical protein
MRTWDDLCGCAGAIKPKGNNHGSRFARALVPPSARAEISVQSEPDLPSVRPEQFTHDGLRARCGFGIRVVNHCETE